MKGPIYYYSKLMVVEMSSLGRMAFLEKGICCGKQVIVEYVLLRFEQVFLTDRGLVN